MIWGYNDFWKHPYVCTYIHLYLSYTLNKTTNGLQASYPQGPWETKTKEDIHRIAAWLWSGETICLNKSERQGQYIYTDDNQMACDHVGGDDDDGDDDGDDIDDKDRYEEDDEDHDDKDYHHYH